MAELIVFRDAEDLIRLYLAEQLPRVAELASAQTFAGSLPATLPSLSVFVRRTGGPSRDMVTDLAQITLECRAKQGSKAERLAAVSRAVMKAAAIEGHMLGVPVYTVRDLSGGYLDPDPVNPLYVRYSSTYQVAVRGQVVA